MYLNGNVTLMVKDFPGSVNFYAEKLGLPLKVRYGDDWAEFQAPGITVALHPARGEAIPHDGATSIGLEVADIAATYALLKSRGVEFASPPVDAGHAILANFTDPEGNGFYLMQMPSAPR
ncbi:MAG: glyoxalase [Chloroflexi bacterium]|nr:glyoxalase [Chloroflexota bacterium]